MINPSLKEYIYSLDDIRLDNIEKADLFSYLFLQGPITDSESHLLDHLSDVIIFSENEKENESLVEENILPMIKRCETNKYENNPYNKLNIKEFKKGRYSLRYERIKPFELFPLNDISVTSDYKEITNAGYFVKEYKYLTLFDKDEIWMSLNPNEIETMEKDIQKMKGNVLIGGLGLGYFLYMISMKEDVKNIIVLEKDEEIIALFKENIYPLFENKEKIQIIECDVFEYLNKNNLNRFDHIYMDIWHDNNDGLESFHKLMKLQKDVPTPITCWLYDGFIAMLRRCMILSLVVLINNEKYESVGDYTDRIVSLFLAKLKNKDLKNKSDIDNLLKESSLLSLL